MIYVSVRIGSWLPPLSVEKNFKVVLLSIVIGELKAVELVVGSLPSMVKKVDWH